MGREVDLAQATQQSVTDSAYEVCLGYPPSVPQKVFETKEVAVKTAAGKIPSVRVSKSLIVLIVPKNSPCFSLLECGDFVLAVNGKPMDNKRSLYETLNFVGTKGEAQETKISILRPKRIQKMKSDQEVVMNLPRAYERLPGFDYLFTYMVIFPGAKIGLHVKSFNDKIFVVRCDQDSLAETCFAIGDAVLSIDDKPVTVVQDAVNAIAESLKTKKYVQTVVERACTPRANAMVRQALAAEKTVAMDPRMCADTIQIGIKFWKELEKSTEPKNGILKSDISKKTTSRLTIAKMAEECAIGSEPVNPDLLFPVSMQNAQVSSPGGNKPGEQKPEGTAPREEGANGKKKSEKSREDGEKPSADDATKRKGNEEQGEGTRRSKVKSRRKHNSRDDAERSPIDKEKLKNLIKKIKPKKSKDGKSSEDRSVE